MTDDLHPGQLRSSIEDIGPHLLGGNPMPTDTRDYKLADYLGAHRRLASTLTPRTTLQELGDSGLWDEWPETYAVWAWMKANVLHGHKPTPPPPAAAVEWSKLHGISDQGQTGHCVGFTGLDWGNTLLVDDAWPNDKGHEIYYACKVIDGDPRGEEGSDSRSLCKVLKNMGRIGAYAFAASADEAADYVLHHGPVGIGIPWYNGMFSPGPDGVLRLSGGVAGGHEVELNGYDPNTGYFKLVNHWTDKWALGGFAYLRHQDLDKLLSQQGDCWAGLENPL